MNHLIEEQSQLKELEPLLNQLSDQAGHIAVDTEFLREKTYNAKLCLVQLGIGEDQYCIDVLAIEDLSILAELFVNENIIKIFHAARQDMEVLYQTLHVMPKPIFDTQLAAAFCGMDMQLGYAALVKERLGIELSKSQARTDWTRRPLSEEQVSYAADDVVYLEHLYLTGLGDLKEQGKLAWYEEEIDNFYDGDKYIIDPATAYLRLFGGGLKINQQYTLKALAEWRERIAQKRNIPRTWVLKDDRLFDLAAHRPMTQEAVEKLNVFGKKSAKHMAHAVIDLISNTEIKDKLIWNRVEPLDKKDKSQCTVMMKELASIAKHEKIAQGLLATRKDIESLYRNKKSEKLIGTWRETIVGKQLLALVDD